MRLNQLIIGSPLERIARRAYRLFKTTPADAPENATYDEQTFEVMRRCLRKDSNGIDIGCHKGFILKEMLKLAPAGVHYAFEPIPELCRELRSSFPGVNVHDVALNDSVGSAPFQHVTSNPGYSGLRQRRYDRPHEDIEEIRVKTDLLDNIIPLDLAVDFIKIDVEGAEYQVLKGAVNTIRRSKPIVVFEHGLGAADCYGTTPEEVYDLLTAQCGLQISLMQDWLKRGGSLSREDFAKQFYRGLNFYFMAHANPA